MTVYPTPDLDSLVLDALRAANMGAEVRILMPEKPSDHLPLVVARQVPGGTATRLGTVTGNVELKALAATRREASDLARRAAAALAEACRSQFQGADGHLRRFTSATGAPVEQRTGAPVPGPNLFVFRATVRVSARATLTPGG